MANPTKQDIHAASGGMLHKDLYVILMTPPDGIGPVIENLERHLAYQVGMERSGIMFGAGPLWADDEKTWNGDCMFIIRADSLAHAREIAESDPMHSSGARTFTIRPWLLSEGSVTVRMTFSDGKLAVD